MTNGQKDSTALARAAPTSTTLRKTDTFELMDRLDDALISEELKGIVSNEWVYDVSGKVGLSKVGIDESCNMLAKQGEVIREDGASLRWEMYGKGDDVGALFVISATRYRVATGVDDEGKFLTAEVRLDQTIGTKRQPLYYEAKAMSLDSKVGFGKHRTKTWREVMDDFPGYVEWAATEAGDEDIRDFATAVLEGQDVHTEGGKKLNPFWFEHGSIKAARNARNRLLPSAIKAEVIALAKRENRVKRVDAEGIPTTQNGADRKASPDQVARVKQLLDHELIGAGESTEIREWLDRYNWVQGAVGKSIATLKSRIADRGGTIEDLPKTPSHDGTVCPECGVIYQGADVPKDGVCKECGAKLSGKKTTAPDTDPCEHCGAPLTEAEIGLGTCPECKGKLDTSICGDEEAPVPS